MKSKLVFALGIVLAIILPAIAFAASFGTQNFFYAPGNVITPLPGFGTSWSGTSATQPFLVGSAASSLPQTMAQFSTSTLNSFAQVVLWNTNIGNNASADLVFNDASSTQQSYFAEFGEDGANYSQSAFSGESPHDLFAMSSDANVDIETASTTCSACAFKVFTGGTTATQLRFIVNNTGFVGINNSSPAQFLDVGGNVNVSQNNGYMINGVNALYASTTNANIAVGSSAAATWMAASSTASNNVAVGKFALNTGPSTFGATANTAIGVSALASLTSGVSNTAVGFNALQGNTSNNNNTAIGYNSMNNSTAGFSTAIGWGSLAGGGGGSFNTALGYQAMGNYTSNASNNVAVGFKSLLGLTTGNNNISAGFQNGGTVSSGGGNIYIGANTASTTQTGSNNITIGFDISGPQAASNGSNFLDIGNLIFANGLTSQASSSPAGTFSIASSTNSLTAGNSYNTTNGVCHVEKAAGSTTSYDYYYFVSGSATPVYQSTPCSGTGTTTVIED